MPDNTSYLFTGARIVSCDLRPGVARVAFIRELDSRHAHVNYRTRDGRKGRILRSAIHPSLYREGDKEWRTGWALSVEEGGEGR